MVLENRFSGLSKPHLQAVNVGGNKSNFRNQTLYQLGLACARSLTSSMTRKNRQKCIKIAKNDFTRKIKDFNSFTKIA